MSLHLMDPNGVNESPVENSIQVQQSDLQSATMSRRLRSEDSWIDLASQPSTSSLSSAGDNEVITTGLSIQNRHRRRRSQKPNIRRGNVAGVANTERSHSAHGSSQDEYDESESDSDRVMSSSNEDIQHPEEHDNDRIERNVDIALDHATFTPQPNAFSHPPLSNNARSLEAPTPIPYFAAVPQSESAPASTRFHQGRPIHPRPAYPSQIQYSHPRTVLDTPRSSSHQPDHDAALRASLTTLLSCAAAVRGSPKASEIGTAPRTSRPSEPTTLRLVRESHFLEDDEPIPQPRPQSTRSPPSPRSHASKRKAREQSKDRLAKRTRNATTKTTSDDEMILSPTLMTWMISAGVVLVFSAISFSAGYAWGREVGRFEGEMGISSSSCSREAIKGSANGLRRLRWTGAATSVRA